ncbi:anthranilate synthase [Paenibacillus yonginensis]|uniref:Anthranilate synthase n=1 Tax=Paenibacillus yonginensis TaxID=1462996 RepID=A0A1B1N7E2_9BACL|nr:anthranilate synthase component I family protein [Paenibacillus yonginensis]ANS77328.1 anthranilate synthase [Paenibacillus yonginensis]
MGTVLTTWDQWKSGYEEGWSLLPVAVKRPGGRLPQSWESLWESASPYSFVLESGKDGRYTVAGTHPVEVLRGKGDSAELFHVEKNEKQVLSGQPLQVLENWMRPYRAPALKGLPKFGGGFVGYLSYDVARSLEKLPQQAEDDLQLDDYIWMRMEEVWIYDHEAAEVYALIHVPVSGRGQLLQEDSTSVLLRLEQLYKQAINRAEAMLDDWEQLVSQAENSEVNRSRRQLAASPPEWDLSTPMAEEGWTTSFGQAEFEAAVHRIQAYIAAGDVFQVNLSMRRQRRLQASAEELYEWFRIVNPSPYMGLLRFPEFQLVSGSPELLVSLHDGQMGARPIAGTRRRGRDAEEDAAMAAELLGSEKERAEHIMLVDLERNDLGRVAAYGTVKVSELLKVEYYSHVMHLVSQVEGELGQGHSLFDLIAAAFPGGTITGAPKVRTMEIIEELEPVTRGPYTGSIGWIDYQGNMDLNIVIRTMIVQDGYGHIQTGAGVVIDSDPYREYRECENKARAARTAVRYSELSRVSAVTARD